MSEIEKRCPRCGGSGEQEDGDCGRCGGYGTVVDVEGQLRAEVARLTEKRGTWRASYEREVADCERLTAENKELHDELGDSAPERCGRCNGGCNDLYGSGRLLDGATHDGEVTRC